MEDSTTALVEKVQPDLTVCVHVCGHRRFVFNLSTDL